MDVDRVDSVSVVVPIYNEVENLPLLYDALNEVLTSFGREYEMILVDDGSLLNGTCAHDGD